MIPTTSFAQEENKDDKDSKKTEISVSSTRSYVMKGDVNGDYEVNQTDVEMTVDYMLHKNPDGFNVSAADIDGNGTVSIADLVSIITLTPHESTIGGSIGDNN